MEMKWEIKRMPGCFKGDPCYYQVKLNGNPVISFSKKRTAEQFVKMFGKELEENEKKFQEEFLF